MNRDQEGVGWIALILHHLNLQTAEFTLGEPRRPRAGTRVTVRRTAPRGCPRMCHPSQAQRHSPPAMASAWSGSCPPSNAGSAAWMPPRPQSRTAAVSASSTSSRIAAGAWRKSGTTGRAVATAWVGDTSRWWRPLRCARSGQSTVATCGRAAGADPLSPAAVRGARRRCRPAARCGRATALVLLCRRHRRRCAVGSGARGGCAAVR